MTAKVFYKTVLTLDKNPPKIIGTIIAFEALA